MARTRVLLIEANDHQAKTIEELLAGNDDIVLERILSMSDAVDTLRRANEFDIVLLNSRLIGPQKTRSFPLLRRGFPELPLVIIFPAEKRDLARSLVGEGADECLCEVDIETVTLQAAIRVAIERRHRVLAERKVQQTEEQLELASQIQQQMLPTEAPQIPGFEVAGQCQPAAKCAGDFFDFIQRPSDGLLILIADVSSHGFAPALIMANTRRLVRELAHTHGDLGKILTLANEAITDDSLEGQFVTMFLSRLVPATRRLTYVGAGHVATVLDERGVATTLASTHMPLGLIRDTVYEESGQASLQPRDILLLMSDGIGEARHPNGEYFGKQRAYEIAHQWRDHSAKAIVSELLKAVDRFCFPSNNDDDSTVVVMKVLD